MTKYTMRRIERLLKILAVVLPGVAGAQVAPDTTVKVTFGGFVDSYYAWDFDRPQTLDRSFAGGVLFTTQPARHNEFNINLAFIEAKLDGARVHGRLALQAGTSVQSNYSGEPANGAVSGPTLARHIQEAFAGGRVAPTLWIDGGIFYSHLGMESWASRDNLTYTRSLVADYSPYYSSGVRAVWQAAAKLTAQLHIVNGWQNISENNTGKGAGLRLDYAASGALSVTYYNFFTDEAGNRPRTFNGIGGKAAIGRATFLSEIDVGTQAKSSASGETAKWWGYTAIAKWAFTRQSGRWRAWNATTTRIRSLSRPADRTARFAPMVSRSASRSCRNRDSSGVPSCEDFRMAQRFFRTVPRRPRERVMHLSCRRCRSRFDS
jgi:hypothetical protein